MTYFGLTAVTVEALEATPLQAATEETSGVIPKKVQPESKEAGQMQQKDDASAPEWLENTEEVELFTATNETLSETMQLQQSDLQWWEVLLIDWMNNKNPDYQPIINNITNVFSGNLPIGNTVTSSFSKSFNIKTPGIRRYIGYRPDGGFLNAGLDIWITGDSYTDIKKMDAQRGNFTSEVAVNNGYGTPKIERKLHNAVQGDYLLEVQPQYYLWKLELYSRFDSKHYQTTYPSKYYYGDRRQSGGSFQMPKYSMEIKDNKVPSLTVNLGTSSDSVDEMLQNELEVSVGGERIDKAAYTIAYTNFRNDTVGRKELKFTLSWKDDPSVKVEGKANLEVKWGSSIALGALDLYGNGRTGAVFTLQQNEPPIITASQGMDDDNQKIHDYFPNQKYYGVDWFTMDNRNERDVSEITIGDQSIASNGDELKQEALKKWTDRNVNYGDVVRAWQVEPGRNWLYENEQRKTYSDGKNAVYYEITKNGFIPITINKLSPKTQVINYGQSLSELDNKVKSYLDTGSYTKLTAVKFVKYPDTGKQGKTEGTIQVAETLSSGKQVTYNYTVPFEVDRLTASANPGSIDLGTDMSSQALDYSAYVKDVAFNGQALKADEYTVSPQNIVASSSLGIREATLRVFLKRDNSKFVDVVVPLEIKWGNSVVFGSYDLGADGRTGAAFTLHPSANNGIITASLGRHNDNEQIHSSFPGKKYYGFDWFDLTAGDLQDVSEEKNGTKSIVANGDERKREAIQKWRPQAVNYGDVVRAWNLEPFRNWLYEDEQMQTYNDGKTSVYYETTKSGFKPLDIDKLSVKRQTINFGMSKNELDKNLKNYLSIDGYEKLKLVKFTEYPDTSIQGTTNGRIQVTETLSSGKKITYEYTIPFQVDRVTADSKATSLNLGTVTQTLDYRKFVENVQFNGQKLNEAEYTVEAKSELQTGLVGNRSVTVQVSLEKDSSKNVLIDVPITIQWGNSIAYGSYDIYGNGRNSAAFTLHTVDSPLITASPGISDDNEQIHSSFINLKYYGFDWFDLSKSSELAFSEMLKGNKSIEGMGNERKRDSLAKWTPQPVNYGDVVRAWQLEPGKNWLYENEQRMTYSDSKNAVYYEVTASGFRLLQLNKLSVKKQVVDFDMTSDELDKNITAYLDTSSYGNLEIVKFIDYPDTSKGGQTEGTIRIAETLSNNKKITYDYIVPFEVSDPTALIDVSLPTKVLFGSLEVEDGQVSSPKYRIENNSKKKLKVTLDRAEVSDNPDSIRLLEAAEENPSVKEQALRLALQTEQAAESLSIVAGRINQQLTLLAPESRENFQMSGQYFGDFQKNTSLSLKLSYTFQAIGGK